jgi:hypothetical protein
MVIDDKVVSAKLFKEIVVVRRVHQRVIYTEEEEKKKTRQHLSTCISLFLE